MVLLHKAWQRIGTPPNVLNWIANGIHIPFHTHPECFELKNHKLLPPHVKFVDNEIKDLLSSNAIRLCDPGEIPYCVSPIQCVPKKNGKLRLVVDLRNVNDFIQRCSFQNEGISTVSELIEGSDTLFSVDLKNGYHHVPIHIQDQRFLGIKWRNRYYVWQVLPFGLRCSSYFFCKTIRPAIQFLREQGLRICSYVDDVLLMTNKHYATDHKDMVIDTFSDLGLVINFDKSELEGQNVIQYIGFSIHTDGADPWITVPNIRIRKLKKDIRRCLNVGFIQARFLARIAGQCISMCKAILPGKLLLRNIYRLLQQKTHWHSVLELDHSSRRDLDWWLNSLDNWNGAPLKLQPIEAQIETDASASGWGAYCNIGHIEASGIWSVPMHNMPSNYRELMAVHMALLSFKDTVHGKVIQVLSDNITSVAYLNHLGGHCTMLSNLSQAIWCTANDMHVTIRAKYLAGDMNWHADKLSRLSAQYEWMLNPRMFQFLNSLWGPFTIDRFASLLTMQLPKYNSLYYDPQCSGVDALAQADWGSENNFIKAPSV